MSIDSFEIPDSLGETIQVKLEQVITNAPPQRTSLVIRKVMENLVLAERVAQQHGIEIEGRAKRAILQKDYTEVQAEVDRALSEFIGSILSAEGG